MHHQTPPQLLSIIQVLLVEKQWLSQLPLVLEMSLLVQFKFFSAVVRT